MESLLLSKDVNSFGAGRPSPSSLVRADRPLPHLTGSLPDWFHDSPNLASFSCARGGPEALGAGPKRSARVSFPERDLFVKWSSWFYCTYL